MQWITRLFSKIKPSQEKSGCSTRNFLRMISPHFDQSFQLSEEFSLEMAKSAQKKHGYFFFITHGGRQCAINFANIHAMQFTELPEIDRNSFEIEGVRMHFVNDEQPLEIPALPEEIAEFFSNLASESVTAELSGWTVEKASLILAVASSNFRRIPT